MRKRNFKRILIGCSSVTTILLIIFCDCSFKIRDGQLAHNATRLPFKQSQQQVSQMTVSDACKDFLIKLTFARVQGIIVDSIFLKKLATNKSDCTISHLKVAVLDNENSENGRLKIGNVTLDVITYSDDRNKDYWIFHDKGIQRAVPKISLRNVSRLYYPEDPVLFNNYWRRSRLLECANVTMHRKDTSRHLKIPKTFEQMAQLRDLLTSYGMYPILFSGTLLGWYRECSLIPHTKDIDFAVFVDQYSLQFEVDVLAKRTPFKMMRRFGMLNDSLEYTVALTNSPDTNIDIFFAYQDIKGYWLGGTDNNGDKFRYDYPRFNAKCTADLGGYLFWIACEPEALLEADYGTDWRQDHPTSKYIWKKSGKNVRKVGKWPRRVINQVVVYYERSLWQFLVDYFVIYFY